MGGDNSFATGYALGQNDSSGRGNSSGMWGDQWIWILIVFALLFGWGGNGWGGGNGGGNNMVPFVSGIATRSDIMDGFMFNDLQRGVSAVQQGICDSTYALTNALNSGFSSAELSRCNQQAALMQQLNNLSFQNQQCCCETQRAIDGVKYDMATGFCAMQNTANNNTRDIIDRILSQLCQMEMNRQQEKIQELQSENQNLKFQASQTAQNSFIDAVGNSIVAQLRPPVPVPSYAVPAPYPYGGCCGCNTGCGSCCA